MRLVLLTIMLVSFCTSRLRGDDDDGTPSNSAQGPATERALSALDKKIAALLPGEDENRWLQIPWQANLMQARLESQRAGKPLLIWVMDGDVLGCT